MRKLRTIERFQPIHLTKRTTVISLGSVLIVTGLLVAIFVRQQHHSGVHFDDQNTIGTIKTNNVSVTPAETTTKPDSSTSSPTNTQKTPPDQKTTQPSQPKANQQPIATSPPVDNGPFALSSVGSLTGVATKCMSTGSGYATEVDTTDVSIVFKNKKAGSITYRVEANTVTTGLEGYNFSLEVPEQQYLGSTLLNLMSAGFSGPRMYAISFAVNRPHPDFSFRVHFTAPTDLATPWYPIPGQAESKPCSQY